MVADSRMLQQINRRQESYLVFLLGHILVKEILEKKEEEKKPFFQKNKRVDPHFSVISKKLAYQKNFVVQKEKKWVIELVSSNHFNGTEMKCL